MTARRLALPTALIAFALSARARAFSGGGSADVGYSQAQTWSPGAYDRANPWDYGLQLGLSDSVIAPTFLQWILNGSYRRQHTLLSRGSNDNNVLSYNAATSLLSQSRFPINLYASRGTSDFASETSVHTTGSAQTMSLGGNISVLLPDLPVLRLSIQRVLLDTTNLFGGETTSQSTQLEAGMHHSIGRNSFGIDYGTSWNSGNTGPADFRGHAVNGTLASNLSDDLQLTLFDRYYLRLPRQESATNPRWDDQALSAALEWRLSPTTRDRIEYRQQHQLFRAAGTADSEVTQYTASNSLRRAFSSELQAFATGNASYGIERLKVEEIRAASETAGGGVDWRRTAGKLSLSLSGSGDVGAVQQRDDGTRPTWTVNGSAGGGWTEEPWSGQAGYSIGYAQNGATLIGSTLTQRAYASAGGQPGPAGSLRATLNASLDVRHDQLLGNALNRAASAGLGWTRGVLSVNGEAGLAVGATNGVAPGILATNTPIAPTRFNTTQLHATLSAFQVWGRWRFNEILRTLTKDVPGLPNDTEHSAALVTAYQIGLITFSAEERFSLERTSGSQRTASYFVVRIARSFGFGP